jgi:hypothetical protein
MALVLTCATLVTPPAIAAQNLRLVGHTDLGGAGLNGDVTVIGTTAVVAAGMMAAAGVHANLYNPLPCPAVAVKLVDLADPARPRVVGTIPVPAGVAAHGVSAAPVRTPAFTGDLLAVALTMCSAAGSTLDRGVEYYDITNPATPQLLGRYRADDDIVRADSVPRCGPPPQFSGTRCASSQHSVSLIQRADGRVLSLSLEPGAAASRFPSGDLRVVDVTDPRSPIQIGAFPPAGTPIFSNNGCRPFTAGHGAAFTHGGTRGLLAFYDGGIFVLDLDQPGIGQLGQFTYPDTRAVEGSAAYVAAARVNGRDLAVVSEADFIGPSTSFQVSGADSATASMFACEAVFTLYDQSNRAQLHRQPGHQLSGPLAYIGRGCPVSRSGDMMHGEMAMSTSEADSYLSDVRGHIAVIDRSRQPIQPAVGTGSGCSVADRVRHAQSQGAIGVVLMQTSTSAPQAFSPDGDPAGITIPVIMIDKGDGDALRTRLCPALVAGRCAPTARVNGTMRSEQGEWGAVRVVDVTDPAVPRERGVYRTPNSRIFPPRDLGVISPQRPVVRAHFAVVPWNSDGVRVLDLTAPTPREIAAFVPPDVADPGGVLPAKAYVMSVGVVSLPARGPAAAARDYIVVSDLNSGLYVVEAPWR